jgi:type IV pilus assembly protein PilA
MVKKNEGFTLIELMIVIAIIGILAAIAIPQFNSYRKRSYNAAAQSDLKNMSIAQEAYFVEKFTYTGNIADLTGVVGGFYPTAYVEHRFGTCDTTGYVMRTYHPSGDSSYILRGPGGVVSKQ